MIEVTFADLHNPVFLAGTNLGQKLDVTKRTGLVLKYEDDAHRLWIQYNGLTCFTPDANILSCQPKNPADLGVKNTQAFVPPHEKVKTAGPSAQIADISHAQGETPHGYRKGK
jgi:hypothetical protein